MDFFTQFTGLIFLGLCAFWIYALIKNRTHLFQRSILLKASQTLAFIALMLCALVAFLMFMIEGEAPTGSENMSENHSSYPKKYSSDTVLDKAI